MVSSPYYADDEIAVHHGDCLEVLPTLEAGSVDAVVCDPPYGLEFMGKDWDRPWAVSPTQAVGFTGREDNLTLPAHRDGRNANCRGCGGRQRGAKRCTCEAPQWDRDPAADMRAFQDWCEAWATECLRVLKPGGHLLAFGGTRTHHRLACAIEDAGFEIRDSIAWLYGSGFPKSLDVSKAIDRAAGAEREVVGKSARHVSGKPEQRTDGLTGSGTFAESVGMGMYLTAPTTDAAKQWQGWGTALKPAFEPIVVARKPVRGTVAGNVVAHGTGALNIDGCRIGTPEDKKHPGTKNYQRFDPGSPNKVTQVVPPYTSGRWPSNVVLDEHQASRLDQQSGQQRDGTAVQRNGGGQRIFNQGDGLTREDHGYNGAGGASRFFPVFKYTAKANGSERPTANGVSHPTVKPLDLMRWLVRLITPQHGLVLDPFAGSGTTAEACIHEHMRCITIEREADYLPLIMARLSKPMAVGFDFGADA